MNTDIYSHCDLSNIAKLQTSKKCRAVALHIFNQKQTSFNFVFVILKPY